jgi:hypothetical protein
VTNPATPALGQYNQTGDSRLISVNSYDVSLGDPAGRVSLTFAGADRHCPTFSPQDFCIFAPETSGDTIGDQEERVVSYCTK